MERDSALRENMHEPVRRVAAAGAGAVVEIAVVGTLAKKRMARGLSKARGVVRGRHAQLRVQRIFGKLDALVGRQAVVEVVHGEKHTAHKDGGQRGQRGPARRPARTARRAHAAAASPPPSPPSPPRVPLAAVDRRGVHRGGAHRGRHMRLFFYNFYIPRI